MNIYNEKITAATDWGGDESTGGLPVSGEKVLEFIKDTLADLLTQINVIKLGNDAAAQFKTTLTGTTLNGVLPYTGTEYTINFEISSTFKPENRPVYEKTALLYDKVSYTIGRSGKILTTSKNTTDTTKGIASDNIKDFGTYTYTLQAEYTPEGSTDKYYDSITKTYYIGLPMYYGFCDLAISSETTAKTLGSSNVINSKGIFTVPAVSTGVEFLYIYICIPKQFGISKLNVTLPDSLGGTASLTFSKETTGVKITVGGTQFDYDVFKSAVLIDSRNNKRIKIN